MAKLGVLPHVIAHVANHRTVTKAGVTFINYVQYAYENEKRKALDLWAGRLEAIITNADHVAKVVPFGAA